MLRRLIVTLSIGIFLSIPVQSHADWPEFGARVIQYPMLWGWGDFVADGFGGYVVVWYDPGGADHNVYAQKINDDGNFTWWHSGVPVCEAAGHQSFPVVLPDGTGGVIVAWLDYRTSAEGVYAQRFDADGFPQWAPDGVKVSKGSVDPYEAYIVTDGAGGAIVVWEEWNVGMPDIYAQRVNSSGSSVWTTDAVVCDTTSAQQYASVVSDGAGGVIVAWLDHRGGVTDSYTQRIDDIGNPVWTRNGEPICAHSATQNSPVIATDGVGGAIFAWTDERNANTDVYGQRVDSYGTMLWGIDGIPICDEAQEQWVPDIASDGNGGAYIAWIDERLGVDRDIYAQRIRPDGSPVWTSGGIPVTTAADDQEDPIVLTDGVDGVIIGWEDDRSGFMDVYAQRIDPAGIDSWETDGAPVCSLGLSVQNVVGLAPNGHGGATAVWADSRTGNSELYVQRVEGRYGDWGRPEAIIGPVYDVPLDQGGYVSVNWDASQRDRLGFSEVSHYSVWRAVLDLPVSMAGAGSDGQAAPVLVSLSAVTADFDGAAYRLERTAAAEFYWEWVGNQSAYTLPGYALTVATLYDSTAADPATHLFQVIAHSTDPSHYWFSVAQPGFSKDNLAPGTPLNLSAWRDPVDVRLDWSPADEGAPDFSHYAVFRGENPGVTPTPPFFLGTEADTTGVDSTAAAATTYYYVVTSVDIHGNHSDPSNEVRVDGSATGVGDTPVPEAFVVLSNVPNPFSTVTELRFELMQTADVTIEVYDVAGRRVSVQRLSGMPAGLGSVRFEGRDQRGRLLPSGVYLCRVSALGKFQVRKMVIAR